MQWLQLDELDVETVDDLFVQALLAHPAVPGATCRPREVMMEFVSLITAELEGRLNARRPMRGMSWKKLEQEQC